MEKEDGVEGRVKSLEGGIKINGEYWIRKLYLESRVGF